jgi:hypothetical protein
MNLTVGNNIFWQVLDLLRVVYRSKWFVFLFLFFLQPVGSASTFFMCRWCSHGFCNTHLICFVSPEWDCISIFIFFSWISKASGFEVLSYENRQPVNGHLGVKIWQQTLQLQHGEHFNCNFSSTSVAILDMYFFYNFYQMNGNSTTLQLQLDKRLNCNSSKHFNCNSRHLIFIIFIRWIATQQAL